MFCFTGYSLEEIKEQIRKEEEKQQNAKSANLNEISSCDTRATSEGITTQDNSSQSGTFSLDNVSQNENEETGENDSASAKQENPDDEKSEIDLLTKQENILSILKTERDALLMERSIRRGVETPYKTKYQQYLKDYDALTDKEREHRRWELSALETFEDREREKKLRANIKFIKLHKNAISSLKCNRERESRIGTKRNRELYEQDNQEQSVPVDSITVIEDIDAFNDDMSAITEDEYFFEQEPLPVEHLDEIELQTFLLEIKKEYRRRFGRSLVDYNLLGNTPTKKVLGVLNTRNLKRMSSIGQYGSPEQTKSATARVVSVNVDEEKKRHKRARTELA